MKLVGYYLVFGLFICSCGSSKKEWADFRNADCAKYQFGRIDAKKSSQIMKKNPLLNKEFRSRNLFLKPSIWVAGK